MGFHFYNFQKWFAFIFYDWDEYDLLKMDHHDYYSDYDDNNDKYDFDAVITSKG